MKRIILILQFIFILDCFSQNGMSLRLSEIMFNAPSGNNEFIEIYNSSETQSIDLNGFKVKYYTSSPDIIIPVNTGVILQPKTYAVIFEGDYDFENGIYNSLIPVSALILKIDNNSFGATGMANTTDRPVYLLNKDNDTIDVYTYSADNGSGFSDEKIVLSGDNSSDNWKNSIHIHGTPGYKNSVSLKDNDLTISSIAIQPKEPTQNDNIKIYLCIKNIAANNSGSFNVNLYLDRNNNYKADEEEIFHSEEKTNLASNDSFFVNATLQKLSAGKYLLIGIVTYLQDEDTSNNTKYIGFTVHPPPNKFNDVVINEIMYAPLSGQPEWIELYNNTSSSINLNKWTFHDNSSHVNITTQDKYIPPYGFIVLCKDTTLKNYFSVPVEIINTKLPSLNNTGDIACIKDSSNNTIDSLEYLPDWGGSSDGKSLERISISETSISPDNWGTSKSKFKATPGKINSVSPKDYDLGITGFKIDNKYGIIGNSISLRIKIKNHGHKNSANFSVNLYRDINSDSTAQTNELITTIEKPALISKDSITIGYSISDIVIGVNRFIAEIITTNDEDKENNISFADIIGVKLNESRNDLVINEFMYAPDSTEPEWIEIFNRSDKSVDLNNYQIADAVDTIRIISHSLVLQSKEYVIIAKDSSIQNVYQIYSKIIFAAFPSLNNTSDKIILLDSLNRTIDSLFYSSHWGGNDGRSLERISIDLSSTDSTNWRTSRSKKKATPGFINSVSQKDYDLELTGISFIPQYPAQGESVSIIATVKNPGKQQAQFSLQLFKDTNLDSLPDVLLEENKFLTLAANDSTQHQFQHIERNLIKENGFIVKVVFNLDEDTTNNDIYKKIAPGYPPLSIIVNEIMYLPQGGEPEWIELYNSTNENINLKDWTITDIYTTPVKTKISSKELIIAPQTFMIISRDSVIFLFHKSIPAKVEVINLPTLNNDEDGVIIKDNRNITIDSVHYKKDWGGLTGYSLERKSLSMNSNLQQNWGPSKDLEQSTPGRINSINIKKYDLAFIKIVSSPEFPVKGDDIFPKVMLANNGSYIAEGFNIRLYYNTDSSSAYSFLYEFSNLSLNSGDTALFSPTTPFKLVYQKIYLKAVIIFNADEDTTNNAGASSITCGYPANLLQINEVMYDPASQESEWIELLNTSEETVNIKDLRIGDGNTEINVISKKDYFLKAGEFLILTKDTIQFRNFRKDFSGNILSVNIGSLGNTSDIIVIYDFNRNVIDSLCYNSSWGRKKGFSLERISINKASNDSTNWRLSLSKNGATPGKINSIISLKSYDKNCLTINEIMFDPFESNSEFVEFLNISNDSVDVGGWQLVKSGSAHQNISDINYLVPPGGYFLLASDSSIFNNYNRLKYFPNINILQSDLSLPSTAGNIVLKDAKGNTIDSMNYFSNWHNKNILVTKNKSLERINPQINTNSPDNWSTSVCAEGATPGQCNSIYTQSDKPEEKISVSPNPFSPDNDGFEDFTIINYNLKQTTAQVRIKIFDSQGRLVRTLLNNQASGSSGSVIFDGLNDSNNALRIGIYIIFLEALNDKAGVLETMKTVVVVARKL